MSRPLPHQQYGQDTDKYKSGNSPDFVQYSQPNEQDYSSQRQYERQAPQLIYQVFNNIIQFKKPEPVNKANHVYSFLNNTSLPKQSSKFTQPEILSHNGSRPLLKNESNYNTYQSENQTYFPYQRDQSHKQFSQDFKIESNIRKEINNTPYYNQSLLTPNIPSHRQTNTYKDLSQNPKDQYQFNQRPETRITTTYNNSYENRHDIISPYKRDTKMPPSQKPISNEPKNQQVYNYQRENNISPIKKVFQDYNHEYSSSYQRNHHTPIQKQVSQNFSENQDKFSLLKPFDKESVLKKFNEIEVERVLNLLHFDGTYDINLKNNMNRVQDILNHLGGNFDQNDDDRPTNGFQVQIVPNESRDEPQTKRSTFTDQIDQNDFS